MGKPANKAAGEIALPGFGSNCFVRFTVDSLERLESKFGPKYFDQVLEGLADNLMSVIKTCIEVSIVGGKRLENGDVDFSPLRNLDDVKVAIYDALFLMLYGKTFEEKRVEEEAAAIEQQKKTARLLMENPELLGADFLKQFAAAQGEPASAPPNTEG